jgi:hypothetical protein
MRHKNEKIKHDKMMISRMMIVLLAQWRAVCPCYNNEEMRHEKK